MTQQQHSLKSTAQNCNKTKYDICTCHSNHDCSTLQSSLQLPDGRSRMKTDTVSFHQHATPTHSRSTGSSQVYTATSKSRQTCNCSCIVLLIKLLTACRPWPRAIDAPMHMHNFDEELSSRRRTSPPACLRPISRPCRGLHC
jgi:hypothetical protein